MQVWKLRKKKLVVQTGKNNSAVAGDRTRVARVTGGNTHHYTTTTSLMFKKSWLYFIRWITHVSGHYEFTGWRLVIAPQLDFTFLWLMPRWVGTGMLSLYSQAQGAGSYPSCRVKVGMQ